LNQQIAVRPSQAGPPPADASKPQVTPPAVPQSPPTPAPRAQPSPPAPKERATTSRYQRLLPHADRQNSGPAKSAPPRRHASIAASLLHSDFAARHTPIDEAEREAPQDIFANEYSCLYCAAPTAPDDTHCRACRNKLWLYTPRKPKPSKLYRLLTWNVGINVAFCVLSLLVLIIAASRRPASFPADELAFRLGIITFYGLFYTVILIAYLKRWRILYYLNVFGAIMVLIGAATAALVLGLSSNSGIFCGGILFILGALWFFMILNLGEDFAFDKYRLLLRVDSDAKTAVNLFQRGNKYSQRKMWAMAAIHFRRASSQMPTEITGHLALALAYLNLKKYSKAQEALAEAKILNPTDPAVIRLANELEKTRPA
jgi:hypothetical protein